MDDDVGYEIRARAHELWAQGGRPNASSLALWVAAEAEIEMARRAGDVVLVFPDQRTGRVDPETASISVDVDA